MQNNCYGSTVFFLSAEFNSGSVLSDIVFDALYEEVQRYFML